MSDAYLFDAGWLFFAGWSMVLVAVNLIAFGKDIIPSTTLRRVSEQQR